MKQAIEDAIDITTLICFLVSLFAWGLAFFYYIKYQNWLNAFGIIAIGVFVQLGIGDLVKRLKF